MISWGGSRIFKRGVIAENCLSILKKYIFSNQDLAYALTPLHAALTAKFYIHQYMGLNKYIIILNYA